MILTPLLPHQCDALRHLIAHDPDALFMSQGIGKSLVALAYAEHLKAKLVLITSDKTNVMETWPEQIETHTDFQYTVRPNGWGWYKKSCNPGVMCVLVNYDYLGSCSDWLRGVPFNLWIGDESSEFKDGRTDKHKHLNNIVQDIPHKVILNGSPLTERAEDLWGQFKVLDGGQSLSTSITHFRNQFMQLDAQGYRWCLKRSGMTRIQRAIKDHIFWHDGKGIVMPTRRFHTVTVEMTERQKKIDDNLKRWFAAELLDQKIEVKHAAVLFIKRIQLMGGIFRPTIFPADEEQGRSVPVDTNKLGVLRELIERNRDKKIVVWHEYVPETHLLFDHIRPYVNDKDKAVWVYDDSGNTTPLKQFQEAKSGILLIRNSFCKGLNALADGDIAVFWSNPLSYRDRSQAIGRTCRMNSTTNETHVVDIITKGGADEVVYQQLVQKKSFSLQASTLRSIVEHNQ